MKSCNLNTLQITNRTISTQVQIQAILQAINDNMSDRVEALSHSLASTFADVVEEQAFYDLPFDQIQSIIKQVDFTNSEKIKDPLAMFRTIIDRTGAVHGEKAVLLLNVLSQEKLPNFSIGETALILGKFKNCELLTILGAEQEIESKKVDYDYDWEIKQLKTKFAQRVQQNAKLKKQIKEFPPIAEEPSDFEPDIFIAARKGKLTSVRYLLEVKGIDKNIKVRDSGYTLLHLASATGKLDVVKYLCERQKVDIEPVDNWGRTPFWTACQYNHIEIVKYLCENYNINKNKEDNEGLTPILECSRWGKLDIVKYLIENQNVDKNARSKTGRLKGLTPLYVANRNVKTYLQSIGAKK